MFFADIDAGIGFICTRANEAQSAFLVMRYRSSGADVRPDAFQKLEDLRCQWPLLADERR